MVVWIDDMIPLQAIDTRQVAVAITNSAVAWYLLYDTLFLGLRGSCYFRRRCFSKRIKKSNKEKDLYSTVLTNPHFPLSLPQNSKMINHKSQPINSKNNEQHRC